MSRAGGRRLSSATKRLSSVASRGQKAAATPTKSFPFTSAVIYETASVGPGLPGDTSSNSQHSPAPNGFGYFAGCRSLDEWIGITHVAVTHQSPLFRRHYGLTVTYYDATWINVVFRRRRFGRVRLTRWPSAAAEHFPVTPVPVAFEEMVESILPPPSL